MLAQRNLMDGEVFKIVAIGAAVVHALRDVCPAHARHSRAACRFAGAGVLKNVTEVGIETTGVIADGLPQIKPTVVCTVAYRVLRALRWSLFRRLGTGRRFFALE